MFHTYFERNVCSKKMIKDEFVVKQKYPISSITTVNPLILSNMQDATDTIATDFSDACIVCRSNKRNIILSCGHQETCAKCTNYLVDTKQKCPTCNREILMAFIH